MQLAISGKVGWQSNQSRQRQEAARIFKKIFGPRIFGKIFGKIFGFPSGIFRFSKTILFFYRPGIFRDSPVKTVSFPPKTAYFLQVERPGNRLRSAENAELHLGQTTSTGSGSTRTGSKLVTSAKSASISSDENPVSSTRPTS